MKGMGKIEEQAIESDSWAKRSIEKQGGGSGEFELLEDLKLMNELRSK